MKRSQTLITVVLAIMLAFTQAICPPRSVLSAYGCKPCPPGHYNLEPLGTICKPCPRGQFLPPTGEFAAFPCTPCGRVESARPASSACTECPPGAAGVLDECVTCLPGEQLVGTSCMPCAAGSISASFEPDNPVCTPCATGSVPNAGRTACVRVTSACEKGYVWNLRFRECRLCGFRSVVSDDGTQCLRCADGLTSRPDGRSPEVGGRAPGLLCYACDEGMHASVTRPRGVCVRDVLEAEGR